MSAYQVIDSVSWAVVIDLTLKKTLNTYIEIVEASLTKLSAGLPFAAKARLSTKSVDKNDHVICA